MPARVKICGLRRVSEVAACIEAGAGWIGLNFYAPSPRSVDLALGHELSRAAEGRIGRVALTVDADDATLAAIVSEVGVDMLQLHGRETPERVAEVRRIFGLPVMKAVGVAGPEDLGALDAHAEVADWLLVDAKPPRGAALPGGNGLAFDHRLVAGRDWTRPWMLAGGLTPDTVAEALRLTGAPVADVSSGVEAAPGVKDGALVAAFCAAATSA